MNYLNFAAIFVVAYLSVFLEASFTFVRVWLGTQPDLLPPLMVYCGLSTGLISLSLVAVLAGIWFDSLSSNPLGVSVLPLFVVGWAVYSGRELFLRDQPYARLILGAAGSAVAPFLTVLMLWGCGSKPLVGWGSLWQWIVLTVSGGLVTPILFWMFDRLNSALSYSRTSELTFRPDREIKRGRG